MSHSTPAALVDLLAPEYGLKPQRLEPVPGGRPNGSWRSEGWFIKVDPAGVGHPSH
jgi:hypothetical protein